METKNLKRGIRIAQKSTYKHHSRDNSFCYKNRVPCNNWNDHRKTPKCSWCNAYRNSRYGGWVDEQGW